MRKNPGCQERGYSRLLTWAVGIVLAAFLATACGGRSTENDPDSQALYGQEIIKSRKEMFDGRVTYTELSSAKVGRPLEFEARLEGFRLAKPHGQKASGSPRLTGRTLVGTLMGVKLHCSGAGVRCTALSSERQNVLTPDDVAKWQWVVKPTKTGTMTLALTVTAYYRDTRNVLFEKPPFSQEVHVGTTASHAAQGAASDMGAVVTFLAALLGLGVACATISEFWQRRTAGRKQGDGKKKRPPRRPRYHIPVRVRRRNRR
ncbi:hypothetical protein [Streptomyces longispororuber]|uniref:hypothetical protein n=1 Tax=Streptomyces longispororuber TaxID=68230 RepID=UPI00167EAA04|nr:hypothetical protein [Streptomyces longispororuber]